MGIYPDDIHRSRLREEPDEQFPSGNSSEEQKKKPADERDPDDLVHRFPIGKVKPDDEIDPDDAIHQKPSSRSGEAGMADPDDLVHGS